MVGGAQSVFALHASYHVRDYSLAYWSFGRNGGQGAGCRDAACRARRLPSATVRVRHNFQNIIMRELLGTSPEACENAICLG